MCRTRVVALALGVVLGLAGGAQAAGFTVNSLTDAVDAVPGDGFCATLAGECTLRAAIQETNALVGDDGIVLPAGTYHLTIPGANEDDAATGDLDIVGFLELIGFGASTTTIDVEQHDRVFHVLRGSELQMSGVTIQDGSADVGGGILQQGPMILIDCVLQQNVALGAGGAIYSLRARLELIRTLVSGNRAETGGGLFVTQSGSFLVDSAVADNVAVDGGGIANFPDIAGTMRLTNTTVRRNRASRHGGGINGGAFTVIASTINDNRAAGCGGGIAAGVNSLGIGVVIVNSTISRNKASLSGGGICLGTSGTVLRNATVAYNTADADASGDGDGGGLHMAGAAGSLNIANTLVARNVDTGGQAPDCGGQPLTSEGYNLIENPLGCTINGDPTGNILGLNAAIGGLANNGGLTSTHALQALSPARDAGNPSGCVDNLGNPLTTDQRGALRPQGAACDIGSFEFGKLHQ